MALVLELDTDEPIPYSLAPVRTGSFLERADILICRCDPVLRFSAQSLQKDRGIAAKFVGICSRTTVGKRLDDIEAGMHPVNVVVIDSDDSDVDLTSDNAVFAAIGFVRPA